MDTRNKEEPKYYEKQQSFSNFKTYYNGTVIKKDGSDIRNNIGPMDYN